MIWNMSCHSKRPEYTLRPFVWACKHHNRFSISQKRGDVKRFVVNLHKFSVLNKKLLLSFYNLPIAKGLFL